MFERPMPSRRRLMQSAGAVTVLAASPLGSARAASADVTGRLARYMVSARDTALPDTVMIECKNRILDTLGAMVSGSRMVPGMAAAWTPAVARWRTTRSAPCCWRP